MNKTLQRKIRINGRFVRMICGQMMFDDFELDWPSLPKKKPVQKCECGSQAIGIKPFMPGHSDYCPVNENKTPSMWDNPYNKKSQ